MPVTPRDDLLNAVEVAQRLGVRPQSVLRWYRQGRIPGRKLGHKILRFGLDDVLAALESTASTSEEVADGR
jgi:excisionase family DNA binding protein